jgi:hypothetical protein
MQETLPHVSVADGASQCQKVNADTGRRTIPTPMTDAEREYAIREAGKALEAAQATAEASSCFHDIAARDEARRYMEALIRGRSQEQVRQMERELGLE